VSVSVSVSECVLARLALCVCVCVCVRVCVCARPREVEGHTIHNTGSRCAHMCVSACVCVCLSVFVCVSGILAFDFLHLVTGRRRRIGCLVFIGHFPQKSPIRNGSLAERDL